jgi:glycosyltransferase involved in cell wall biosynthesis/cellulose synthase/poly-beta-1,6-N-acetylglucosamine synthase-like glycosyltransferase
MLPLMLPIVFWTALALIAYTYAGFPLLLFLRSRWFSRPVRSADITPHVTLLIVAHNEAAVMRGRLENVLELDYPRDRLTVLVASDGSDDGTNEIVAGYAGHGIRLLAFPRDGKIPALNAAVAHAQGDILVFSDANTMCAADALRKLVRPFADPAVGGVAGYQLYTSAREFTAGFGERAYSDLDQLLKRWESAAGSVTQATGALYAIRRELFEPVSQGLGDDMAISFRVIARGYRLVYEPRAVAMECVAPSAIAEFQRKVRLCALGFHSVYASRALLNPWRYGFYSLQLFSRKVLRWALPWPLLAMLFSSLALVHSAPIYTAAFALQAVFYTLALSVAFLPEFMLRPIPRVFTLPYYFCLAYAGAVKAQWITLCGRRWTSWAVTPRELQADSVADPPAGRGATVGYIMSRFPKITETFVSHEILQHQQRGDRVEIFPLMRERQPVVHPEISELVARAHFKPWFSPAILRANWYYLLRRPRAYLAMVAEALRGNFGSLKFFLGALAFMPKSVAFAYDMEREGIAHVHAHFATHAALSALIIHRLTGIPFSFTAHAHDVYCDRRMLCRKLEAAAFAAAISDLNRNLMARECGEHLRRKIHVIHCGADTAYFTPTPTAPPPGPLRIICVASLLEMKGHRELVEACRLLRGRGVDFRCDLIGAGELRAGIAAQIAAAGLQDAITLHGPQPRAVVRRMMQQSHVKALPSVPLANGLCEGIPVALMEAMACGLPVVSTVLSGIPELVEDGVSGFLVQPRDTVALADALERLARDPGLRARMGKAGRAKVRREFDLSANAERLWNLFAGKPVMVPAQQVSEVA